MTAFYATTARPAAHKWPYSLPIRVWAVLERLSPHRLSFVAQEHREQWEDMEWVSDRDHAARVGAVLETFVEAGADD
jgi:hypothetical protein